jgi:hypothetical protein
VYVTTIHEEIPYIFITGPSGIIETIIKNKEVPRIYRSGAPLRQVLRDLLGDEFLALKNIGDHERGILFMDKEWGDDLTVELVGTFCT